jgi:membrane-associated protease RseP (regulator of RpoE activity)
VSAVVIRDGQKVTLNVEPDSGTGLFEGFRGLKDWEGFAYARPAIPAPPAPVPPPAWRMEDFFSRGGRLGITVDNLSPQLAEYFGTKEGVLVTSVQDASAGAKAGLKAGDVITSVNGSAVNDPADLRRRLQNVDEGQEFTISVTRDKKPVTLQGKLEQSTRRRSYRTTI